MTKLFAQPYNNGAQGFYFNSAESYERQAEGRKDAHGQEVEEFEIQFIEGEWIDEELFNALSITQARIEQYFDAVEEWSDDGKIRVMIAVGECGAIFGPDSRPDDYDVTLYEMDSLKDLAKQFVEDGHYGEIPEQLRPYLDMNAIARDLSMSYSETRIAGRNYVYWCR